ncbi:sugar transferase [Acinetobacter sp. ANC 5579]|nr:sugar transferase [Acinetobacter amyesii]
MVILMLKRLLDIIIASIALILLSPLYAYVAYKVKKNLGSPVLFRQVRPGLNGKPFEMIKFRTMKDAVDEQGNPLPDSERLTSFGKMLRSTSLDEMPELWNVIKGDMSVVGPRPLLMEYLPLYNEEQAKRHNVRPGMTGHAQVNGRNAISWEEKFKLDTWYVENQSTVLDFKIMLKTVQKVIAKDDISAEGEATMTRFTGSKHKDEK